MPNKTHGDLNKSRARRVFMALFDYVNVDTDKPPLHFSQADFDEKKDGLTFFFHTKKAGLWEICTKNRKAGKDEKENEYDKEIRKAVSELLPALGRVVDKRTKRDINGGVWKFDITFWSIYRAENIHRFDREWEEKKSNGGFESIEATVEQLEPPIPTLTTTTPTQPQQRRLIGNANSPIPNWVGREELLIELHTELENNRRVLVLCGQGGIGKTSLAVKLMATCGVDTAKSLLLETCPYDNVLFRQVKESDSFESLVGKFFKAFGLASNSNGTPAEKIESIVQQLHQQRWLVVLDNLESLMEFDSAKSKSADVGDLLNKLAYGGHNSQIVITSRKLPEDLYDRRGRGFNPAVVGECKIPGISVADSIKLLKELGARDIQADLEWIAGRVGGNVLILGLLASYSKQKPGLLRNQEHLVTKEAKPIVRAQYELQGVPAQDLLQRMCVLRMGMNAEALTILRLLQPDGETMELTSEAEAATEDLLTGLVNSDLLQDRYDESICESRYILHPLMAETFREMFKEDLKLLWHYAARLYGSFDLPEDEIFSSFEDMRFVLEELHFYWLLETDRENLIGIVISGVLPNLRRWCYWDLTEEWLQRILAVRTELGDRAGMATSWGVLGDIARNRGDYDKAEALYHQSLAVYTEIGDRAGMATSWGVLGDIARNRGDYDKAEALYHQSLAVYTEIGDRAGMATSWGVLGYIASKRGDYDKAEALYNQCLAVRTELGDRAGMATSWGVLGDIASKRGDYDKAEALYNQCLAVRTELGDRAGMATSWGVLGDIARNRGDYDKAEALYHQSLTVRTELGDRAGMATSWGVLGYIARNRGDYDKAEALYNQCLAVRTELGDRAGMATSWGVLGDIASKRGDYDKAEALYNQCLAVRTELGDRAGMATSWGVLGDIARNRGDYDKAEALYHQSLTVRTELGDRAGMATSWAY